MGSAMQRAQKTPDGSARFSGLFKVGKRDPFLSRGPATNAVQNIGLLWGSSTVDDFILQLNIIEINIFVNAPTGSKISGLGGLTDSLPEQHDWNVSAVELTVSIDTFIRSMVLQQPHPQGIKNELWVCKTMG